MHAITQGNSEALLLSCLWTAVQQIMSVLKEKFIHYKNLRLPNAANHSERLMMSNSEMDFFQILTDITDATWCFHTRVK